MIEIKISELEKIINKVISDFKDLQIDELVIVDDSFWELSPEYSRDVTLDIPDGLTEEMFTLGSAGDALENLRRTLNVDKVASLNDLNWLGDILKLSTFYPLLKSEV